MDFIMKLLKFNDCNMIMVIVDWFTKYAYIILTTETINAEWMANILLQYIFVNHRIPNKIISDWDKLFISNIW